MTRVRARILGILLLTLFFAASAFAQAAVPDHRARVEAGTYPIGFPGPQQPQLTLAQWMDLLQVRGISIAVIDDYKIAWTGQYGFADAEHKQPVKPTTLFQAGSISKSVNAFGIMRLVEAGALALDEDVNRKLKTWTVPENEFTQQEKVTLRRILSHTAGLTVHGFPGYAVTKPRPTIVQVLNGEKPANTAPVRVDFVPGTKHRYAGGGTTISQLLLTDVTGEPYDRWMQKNVLDAIGMKESSFQNPPDEVHAALTATAYRSDGKAVEGRWHIYPEMAAAGLWTTPSDLAKFCIEMMDALQGQSTLMSRATAQHMISEVKDGAALGFFVNKRTGQFGHNGADQGFRAQLVCFPNGKGVAAMVNSDSGWRAAQPLIAKIAKEYGWEFESPQPSFGNAVYTLAMKEGAAAAIAAARAALKHDLPLQRDPNFALNASFGLFNAGRWDDALALLDYQLEMTPQNGGVFEGRAHVYKEMGKRDEALRAIRRALELNPNNDGAKSFLKELESARR